LEEVSGLSSNFIRVVLSEAAPVNEWIRVLVKDLTEDGLQVSRITTAQETS